jgi:hypothetical protein
LKVSDEFIAGSENHASAPSQGSPGPAAGGGPTRIVIRFIEDIIGSTDSLIEVYSDRVRLSVRRRIVQVAIAAGAAVCAAVWLGAAALATLRGVCGGLTTLWGGREWLGDLTGGLLALALAAGAVALYLRSSSRRALERMKAKYERIRNEHGQEHDPGSSTEDSGGVARP